MTSMEIWITGKQNIRRSTAASYMYLYDSYLRNSLGRRLIDEINTYDIKCFYMSMKTERRLSTETISHIQNVFVPGVSVRGRPEYIIQKSSRESLQKILAAVTQNIPVLERVFRNTKRICFWSSSGIRMSAKDGFLFFVCSHIPVSGSVKYLAFFGRTYTKRRK